MFCSNFIIYDVDSFSYCQFSSLFIAFHLDSKKEKNKATFFFRFCVLIVMEFKGRAHALWITVTGIPIALNPKSVRSSSLKLYLKIYECEIFISVNVIYDQQNGMIESNNSKSFFKWKWQRKCFVHLKKKEWNFKREKNQCQEINILLQQGDDAMDFSPMHCVYLIISNAFTRVHHK